MAGDDDSVLKQCCTLYCGCCCCMAILWVSWLTMPGFIHWASLFGLLAILMVCGAATFGPLLYDKIPQKKRVHGDANKDPVFYGCLIVAAITAPISIPVTATIMVCAALGCDEWSADIGECTTTCCKWTGALVVLAALWVFCIGLPIWVSVKLCVVPVDNPCAPPLPSLPDKVLLNRVDTGRSLSFDAMESPPPAHVLAEFYTKYFPRCSSPGSPFHVDATFEIRTPKSQEDANSKNDIVAQWVDQKTDYALFSADAQTEWNVFDCANNKQYRILASKNVDSWTGSDSTLQLSISDSAGDIIARTGHFRVGAYRTVLTNPQDARNIAYINHTGDGLVEVATLRPDLISSSALGNTVLVWGAVARHVQDEQDAVVFAIEAVFEAILSWFGDSDSLHLHSNIISSPPVSWITDDKNTPPDELRAWQAAYARQREAVRRRSAAVRAGAVPACFVLLLVAAVAIALTARRRGHGAGDSAGYGAVAPPDHAPTDHTADRTDPAGGHAP